MHRKKQGQIESFAPLATSAVLATTASLGLPLGSGFPLPRFRSEPGSRSRPLICSYILKQIKIAEAHVAKHDIPKQGHAGRFCWERSQPTCKPSAMARITHS